MSRRRDWRLVALGLALLLLAGGVAGVHLWARGEERKQLFAPGGALTDDPGRHGEAFEAVRIPSSDGTVLGGWYLPAPAGTPNPLRLTVVWIHGNAVNRGDVLPRVIPLVRRFGVPVLLFDYRGFGDSPGEPSEEALGWDGEAALLWLRREKQAKPERVVVYGHSLGGGIASALASRSGAAALVLEGAFTSVPAMAKRAYPYLPPALLTSSRFDNLRRVRRFTGPLLVIHGEADERIPVAMGKELFAAGNGDKELLLVAGGKHSDCWSAGGEGYWAAWGRLLRKAGG